MHDLHDELENPPAGVLDVAAWREARQTQYCHRAHAGEFHDICALCHTPWPCEARRDADRAVRNSVATPTPGKGPAPTMLAGQPHL